MIGTRKLIEAIGRASQRPHSFLSASAVGYYGDGGEQPLTETSPPGRTFLATVCVDWEREVQHAEALGVRTAIVRTAVVLGPGGALAALLPLFRLGLGGPVGSGRQWFPWISRQDLVRLYLFLLEGDHRGVFLGSGPQPVRQAEFARVLGAALGRPALVPTPAFALRLALGEFASELLESRRCIPERTLAVGFTFTHPTVGEAIRSALAEPARAGK
ncbi:MAG: hypothetical protein KatS3mg061_0001 [Dehalococcoidia bacterium]|nr:MAG: hypothetical protein KatS3mg061_0001 [Dehalococcoidia bacterium]